VSEELVCERCGRQHPVWFAPNEIWNRVIRSEHFLCPTCFVVLADEREPAIAPTGWEVRAA
jgi:hypothetical protein